MPSQTKVQRYIRKLAQLQDGSLSLSKRYWILDELLGEAALLVNSPPTMTQEAQKFIAANGPKIIVDMALRDWPEGGKLSSSQATVDVVEVMHHDKLPPYVAEEMTTDDGDSPRSLRRKAINMLADMSNYKEYVAAMDAAGLYAPDALPKMLEQTMAQLDFPLHNKGSAFMDAWDQSQAIAVHLLNIAGNTIWHTPRPGLRVQLAGHLALRVCALYQDPYSQFVAKAAAQREAERAKLKVMGLDEKQIAKHVSKLREKQHKWELQKYGSSNYAKIKSGCLHHYFIRFFHISTQFGTAEEQLLRLIHEGGLISKLKGCLNPHEPPKFDREGPQVAINILMDLWSKQCYKLSNDMYKRVQEDEARSLELRLAGNAAFRGGQLQEALDQYWKAIALNPEDSSLFNNISLVCAKMGKHMEALFAADESLKVDPTVSKSWARLGDAFRLLERWQLSQLAYTAALKLAPKDPELMARQADARSHLFDVWDIDTDVPDGVKDMLKAPRAFFDWLGLPDDIRHQVAGKSEDVQDFIDNALDMRDGHSRYVACMRIRPYVRDARAIAVATGLLKARSLPPSCQELTRIQDLPQRGNNWMISWTDTPLRHKETGLVRHLLIVHDGPKSRATQTTLGTPGLVAVRKLLIAAMASPVSGEPERPNMILVAHRMFPIFGKITELVKPWGVLTQAETAADAQKMTVHMDTEWSGYNHAGDYRDEDKSRWLVPLEEDYENGHLEQSGQPDAAD